MMLINLVRCGYKELGNYTVLLIKDNNTDVLLVMRPLIKETFE